MLGIKTTKNRLKLEMIWGTPQGTPAKYYEMLYSKQNQIIHLNYKDLCPWEPISVN